MSILTIGIGLAAAIAAAGTAAQDASTLLCRRQYGGIRPDDEGGRNGLRNPERGFRWENRIGSFKPQWRDERWLNQIRNCAADGVTVTQAYCELLDYAEQERIPEEKIRQLTNSFTAVRKSGIKLLLCFRYEMKTGDKRGPTEAIILSHIEQVAPVLRGNMDVIVALQAGFVGLYGEWHRSYHGLDRDPDAQERILRALLDILPPDRRMLMRYPRHKNSFVMRVSGRADHQPISSDEAHTMRPEARIGFCDHGFMVGKNDAGTFAPRPSKDCDYMTRESLFLPMDGEFFWAWSGAGRLKDDGQEAIRRLWEHHYTFFSYAHNHSRYEGWGAREKFGAHLSIDEWKAEALSLEFVTANGLPAADGYFEDAAGKRVERTVFEYVRDHLGYRLELRDSTHPRAAVRGERFEAVAALVNRGFAAPINPRPVWLVVVGAGGMHTVAQAKTDVRKWYPCDPDNRRSLAPPHVIRFATEAFPDLARGTYELGIWMPDNRASLQQDARYAIRLASRAVPWWRGPADRYGVNLIGEVSVR